MTQVAGSSINAPCIKEQSSICTLFPLLWWETLFIF